MVNVSIEVYIYMDYIYQILCDKAYLVDIIY